MGKINYLNSTVYFRDKFVPAKAANLNIASAPVQYGLSIYTVFSIFYNQNDNRLYAFRMRDHYERLLDSARIMDFGGFERAWPPAKFEKVMRELIQRNKVKENVLVRVNVFVDELLSGTKMHGLKTSLSAFIYPLVPLHPAGGIHLGVATWQRTPDNAIPAIAKVNGNYVNSSLIKNEALINDYDDALALDAHGHVTEASVSNVMFVKNGALITPDSATDVLEGITCLSILDLADSLDIKAERRSVDRSEIYTMDEAFLCGSSLRITPVLSVDRRPIGKGKIGPLTKQIIETYNAAQYGTSEDFAHWRSTI